MARRPLETSLEMSLALRYLRSARRDSFTRFLSATAAGGMVVGVAALILALAALAGFQRALRKEILDRTPQIEIEVAATESPETVRRWVLSVAGVEDAQILLEGQGWLLSEGRVRPLSLTGYNDRPPPVFPGIGPQTPPGLWLGSELVETLALEIGDVVEVASTRPGLTPFGPQPRVRRLPLAGVYATGRTEQVARAALPLADAEALLGRSGHRGYKVLVTTGGLEQAIEVAPRIVAEVPDAGRVRTWRDLNRALFFALRLERVLMFLAVLLIVVVAALALVSDLTLLVAAKRREIGMLGAMGATPGLLMRAFLLLGALLATSGIVGGTLLGVGSAWTLDRFRLLRLPSAVYFLDYVPFVIEPADLVLVLGSTLLLALAATGYAARGAAALLPTEALRR